MLPSSTRATMKATISYGILNIPVKIFKAVEDEVSAITFKTRHRLPDGICKHDLHYGPMTCEEHTEKIDKLDHIKIAEVVVDGLPVTLTEAEYKQLLPEKDPSVEILGFYSDRELTIDRVVQFQYMLPEKGSEKALAIFHAALIGEHTFALAKMLRGRKSVYVALVARVDGSFLMYDIRLDDVIREEPSLQKDVVTASDKTLSMMMQIVRSNAVPVWSSLVNETKVLVEKALREKREGMIAEVTETVAPKNTLQDMLDQLIKAQGIKS